MDREFALWLRDNSALLTALVFLVSGAFGVWIWGWQHRAMVSSLEDALKQAQLQADKWCSVALALLAEAHETAPHAPQSRAVLTALRVAFDELFTESELQNIYFDLGVEWDEVSGATKSDKARGLVQHMEKRRRVPELVNQLDRYRPGWRSEKPKEA